MTACLMRFAGCERSSAVRVGRSGEPRLLVDAPDLDRLATLGFTQPIEFADADQAVRERIRRLLETLRQTAVDRGLRHGGIDELLARDAGGGSSGGRAA